MGCWCLTLDTKSLAYIWAVCMGVLCLILGTSYWLGIGGATWYLIYRGVLFCIPI